ncbi:MAG TPA: glycosyltransferase, partial [Bryobacteraceae bacterium]
MPLRIVIDARRVADFGIGTYIRNLVRALARLDRENRYVLITSAQEVAEFSDLPDNFESALRPGSTSTGIAQLGFSLFLRGLNADVFHIPLNAVPLWMPKPYVVTTHDMSTLLFLDQPGYRSNLQRFYLRRGLLRADRVIAVS